MSASGSDVQPDISSPVKFHIEWSIQYDANSGTVYSPARVIGNSTWYLALQPQFNVVCDDAGDKSICAGFFVCHRPKTGSTERPIQVSGTLGLDDGKGGILELEYCKPISLDYTITPTAQPSYTLQRTSYSNPCLLYHYHAGRRNPLRIRAEIEYLENPAKPTRGLHLQQDLAFFQESFRGLYESGICCDFVLVSSDGTEKAVHRAVLIARSPVFAAMFQSDLKECQTGRCSIEDVTSPVLKVLVMHMYCGCSEAEIGDNTVEILMAADKYQLTSLVRQCERSLVAKLTPENVMDQLHLTDGLNVPILKNASFNFIKTHAATLKSSGAIKKLCEKGSPGLVNEVLTFFLPV